MKTLRPIFLAITIIVLALPSRINAAGVSVNSVAINSVGLDEHFFRLGENLMLEHSGMCLKGHISVSAQGMRGKRLFCMIEPVINGSMMEDRNGSCNAIYAFNPSSASYTGKVAFAFPYSWLGMDMNSKPSDQADVKIQVTILDLTSENPVITEKTIALDKSNMRIDSNNIAGDAVGSLMGSLFGGGDGTITCSSCDGSGLCPYCDGDGFIDPSVCRKCSQHPGICRRCHGSGEEEVEIKESGGWFF